MARYEHLPIYNKAMELGVYLDTIVRNFSRYHKYTIGQDLRDLSRNVIKSIICANSSVTKTEPLFNLVQHCEMLKTMLFFAKEAKAFSSFDNGNVNNNKVISNKKYTALIIVSTSWVYFVGANLVFALTIARWHPAQP